MSQVCYLGLDIGGTKILAVLTDANGTVLACHQEPTMTQGGAALIDQIDAIATRLTQGYVLGAIGIGIPASVDPHTHSLSLIPNINNMEGHGFYQALKQRFGEKVYLDNDVNTAALAECEGTDPLAFIAIGTGIGMGLIINGQVVQGQAGAAGEIALLPLGGNAKGAMQRSSGALEDSLGGQGWRDAYHALGGDKDADLAALFQRPDPIFTQVLAAKADLLAQALLAISAVVAPQTYVFGGSIGGQAALIGELTRQLPHYFSHPPQLRLSKWGATAGALGAAYAATRL